MSRVVVVVVDPLSINYFILLSLSFCFLPPVEINERTRDMNDGVFATGDSLETRTTRDWYKVSQVSGEPIFR